MTEYMIIKNGKALKAVKCSEEFAASIAMQVGGEYEKINRESFATQVKERKTRQEKIMDNLTKAK